MGYTASEGVSFGLGQGHFDRIANTDTHVADYNSAGTSGGGTTYHAKVKRWARIKALTACTFDAGVVTGGGSALAEDDVLPIGQELQGDFTTLKLKSGVLIAYRG